MDDRFRFRAWDGKKMYEVASFDNPYRPKGYHEKQRRDPKYKDYNSVTVWDFDPNPNSTRVVYPIQLDKVTLMQSTGLKDKTGKLFFEGDIAKHPYNGKIYIIELTNKTFSGIPLFHPMRDGYCYNSYYGQWEYDEFEIIGNIYENPELLENS